MCPALIGRRDLVQTHKWEIRIRMSQTIEDFQNQTDLEFQDISSERYREYTFPSGTTVRIDNPLLLHVKEDSGSHRLFDAQGRSHRISPNFLQLTWESKDDEPNFVL